MSEYGNDLVLQVSAYIDNDIEVDADGVCWLTNMLYIGEQDEADESRVLFEGVIDSLVEFHQDSGDFRQLYMVAHELARHAERLRGMAGFVEDSDDALSVRYQLPDE